MEDLVAGVEDMVFDVEIALEEQVGALPLPFPGMDKSGAAVCVFHLKGMCERGINCPYRHIKGDRTVVCKHWLRGLCKKGDNCEFLHEYDMTKMPECFFYSRYNACSNKECPFLHIDPESKIRDCPWYDRGFCRHGPNCRHRHTRRVLCINYLCGFCPDGPSCKFVHPRFDLPVLGNDPNAPKKGNVICHYCNEAGHKIYQCPNMPPEEREGAIQSKLHLISHHNQHNPNPNPSGGDFRQGGFNRGGFHQNQESNNFREGNNRDSDNAGFQGRGERPHRPLDQVTCYKCGEKGHYANKCPKGHLAFLSSALNDLQRNRDE